MPPSLQPRFRSGVASTCLHHYDPVLGAGSPQHASINKTPPCGVHRASCPLRAGGGHSIFSTPQPRGVQQHAAINKTPLCGVHRASCPLRAGGNTLYSPPRSRGVSNNMPPSTRPRHAGSTAPPAHCGRGGPHSFLHPAPRGCLTNPALSGGTALALSGEDLAPLINPARDRRGI